MRKTIIGIGTAALLAVSLTAQAAPMQRGHSSDMLPHRALKALDLTDAQMKELKALRESNKDERKAHRDAVKEAHDWIRSSTKMLMEQPEFDATLAAQIAARKAELYKARELAQLEAKFEFKQVLTTEQLAKLEDMRERMRKHKGRGR